MGREKPSAIWIERNYHVILTSKKTRKIADVSRFLKSSIRGLILRSIKSATIRHPVPSAKMPEFLRGTQLLRSEAWESVIPLDTLKSDSCHVANRGSFITLDHVTMVTAHNSLNHSPYLNTPPLAEHPILGLSSCQSLHMAISFDFRLRNFGAHSTRSFCCQETLPNIFKGSVLWWCTDSLVKAPVGLTYAVCLYQGMGSANGHIRHTQRTLWMSINFNMRRTNDHRFNTSPSLLAWKATIADCTAFAASVDPP